MDLTEYRNSEKEKLRVGNLLELVPDGLQNALDIGARDGFITKLLADKIPSVTALDLEMPSFSHERIECVKGDATQLEFPDLTFDLVMCSEVLEHIPTQMLAKACREISRVSRRYVLIGVPYKQDLRVGRMTCRTCGKFNPPWGHVNRFDEQSLVALFELYDIKRTALIGESAKGTNAVASALLDLAGNPYGTYDQEEPCIHCGSKLLVPPPQNFYQKLLSKAAHYARLTMLPFEQAHANWVHVLFEKKQ